MKASFRISVVLLPPTFPSVMQHILINSVRNMWICVWLCTYACACTCTCTHSLSRQGFFPVGLEHFLFSKNFAWMLQWNRPWKIL